jgi:23S rRNA (adenine2503-C2)-methyltransferase
VNSTPDKQILTGLTRSELEQFAASLAEPAYRGRQLYRWIYARRARSFAEMTDLPAPFRERLVMSAEVGALNVARESSPGRDRSQKFLFELHDGLRVETVYLPDSPGETVCISSQVGCALGCQFCATGKMGFFRNLTAGEIIQQVIECEQRVNTRLTNVVFMGMGEPFLNYDATIEAARTINAENGLGIGARRITISTSGIPDGIKAFTQLPQQFRLALSLNASDDETRSKLMPVSKLHPLKEVMAAMRAYTDARGKRVTFEYVLVDGVNNRDKDVKQLAVLLKGIPCKLNLIPLNPFPGCELQAPTPESVEVFARKLWPLVPAVTVRRSKGASILAGCGQLAGLAD